MTNTQPIAPATESSLGKRAVVIGGSIAGLLSARALADHFEQVVVVERDRLSGPSLARKGTPQANHGHILLSAGAAVVSKLFPDLAITMHSAGAVPVDASQDLRWFHHGVWKARSNIGVTFYLVNRLRFESAIRERVRSWPNIIISDSCDVVGLVVDQKGTRVEGIKSRQKGTGDVSVLEADFVVDCSGRGSRTPRWLSDRGFPCVQRSEVKMRVGYASRLYRLPRGFDRSHLPLAVYPRAPETRRMGIMFSIDNEHLMVLLGGWCRDYPPIDPHGFTSFANSLPVAEFGDLLAQMEPIGKIHCHHVPSGLRHHYEQMTGFPDGYLVLGDALCSFNPIYGQGMTVAALEVDVLRHWLQKQQGRHQAAPGSGRHLQRRISRVLPAPWLISNIEDLRFLEVEGRRFWGLSIVQWYIGQILELSAVSPNILRRFMLVMNMLAGPQILLAPYVIVAVFWHWLRKRAVVPGTDGKAVAVENRDSASSQR